MKGRGANLVIELPEHVRPRLLARYVPRRVTQVDDSPRTVMGKVMRLALREVG
jgi:acyl-coenzyme A synthetase/AMP-(fatty) acid ligase